MMVLRGGIYIPLSPVSILLKEPHAESFNQVPCRAFQQSRVIVHLTIPLIHDFLPSPCADSWRSSAFMPNQDCLAYVCRITLCSVLHVCIVLYAGIVVNACMGSRIGFGIGSGWCGRVRVRGSGSGRPRAINWPRTRANYLCVGPTREYLLVWWVRAQRSVGRARYIGVYTTEI